MIDTRSELLHQRRYKPDAPLPLLADLGIDVSDEDIDEARREMWSSFPRQLCGIVGR